MTPSQFAALALDWVMHIGIVIGATLTVLWFLKDLWEEFRGRR